MHNKIWSYINRRFENDGILVHGDEVYEAYRLHFDNGVSTNLIDEVMEEFISCHDLTGILICYEGEIA